MEGFSTSAEAGRPRGSQREGGSDCVIGDQDTLEKKKSVGFQSLHSDGENNPIQGEKKKINNRWGDVQSVWETRVWINQANVFLLISCSKKKKKENSSQRQRKARCDK